MSGSFFNAQGVEYDVGYSICPGGRTAAKTLVLTAEELGQCLAGKGVKRKGGQNASNNNNNNRSTNSTNANSAAGQVNNGNVDESDIPF